MPSRPERKTKKRRRQSSSSSSSSSSASSSEEEDKRKTHRNLPPPPAPTATKTRERSQGKQQKDGSKDVDRKKKTTSSSSKKSPAEAKGKNEMKRSRKRSPSLEEKTPKKPETETTEESKLNRKFDPEDFILWRYPGEGAQPLSVRPEFVGTVTASEPAKSVEIGLDHDHRSRRSSDHHHRADRDSTRRHERTDRDRSRKTEREKPERTDRKKENFTVDRQDRFNFEEGGYGDTGKFLSDRWDSDMIAKGESREPIRRSQPPLVEYPSKLARTYVSYPEAEADDPSVIRDTRMDYEPSGRTFGSTDYSRSGFGSSGPRNIRDALGPRPYYYSSPPEYERRGFNTNYGPRTTWGRTASWDNPNAGQYGYGRGQMGYRGRGFGRGGFRGRGRGTVVYRPGENDDKNMIHLFDPQKVPRGRGYFDHDERDTPRGVPRGRRGGGRNFGWGGYYGQRSSSFDRGGPDDVWKHDMFETVANEEMAQTENKQETK